MCVRADKMFSQFEVDKTFRHSHEQGKVIFARKLLLKMLLQLDVFIFREV